MSQSFLQSNPSDEFDQLSLSKDSQGNLKSDGASESDFKGNKRARASREQVAVLEEAFKINNQPTARTREILAKKLNMPERTVQIWFQNRRAKIKLSQRKHHLALKEEALRQHCLAAYSGRPPVLPPQHARPLATPELGSANMFQQGFQSSPMVGDSNFSPFQASTPYFNNQHDHNSSNFSTPIARSNPKFEERSDLSYPKQNLLPCSVLSIGTWRRMPIGEDELVCSFNSESSLMSWVIGDKSTRFRISFSFSNIKAMELSFVDSLYAELAIDLNGPPNFSTLSKEKIWTPTGDFTESQQASNVKRHTLTGDAQSLRVQLLRLIEISTRLVNLTVIKPTPPSNSLHNPAPATFEQRPKLASFPGPPSLTGTPNPGFSPHFTAMSTFDTEKSMDSLPYMAALALERNKARSLSTPNYAAHLALSAHGTPLQPDTNVFSPAPTPVFDMNTMTFSDFENPMPQFSTDHTQQPPLDDFTGFAPFSGHVDGFEISMPNHAPSYINSFSNGENNTPLLPQASMFEDTNISSFTDNQHYASHNLDSSFHQN